jgi:S-formylglutathione hydrolase FrmB
VSLAVGVAATLDAQGRGGGRPVGRAGTVERITVHGTSLEGNLEDDSPDRQVTVYLPPSYAAEQSRRYPVVYLLHGFGLRDDAFTRLASLAESANRLGAAQGFSESIVVTPDAFTLHKGSMYSSSPTTGDWETFVAEDLVGQIDARYRTLATRMSRGLAGHSMGGYGALRIGMKRPDVFLSLYVMSACCLTSDAITPLPEALAMAGTITTRAQAEEAARAPGLGPSLLLAHAAAWSPNPRNPPLYLDLPLGNGKVRPDVIAKWAANAPVGMLDRYGSNLQKYYAIAIDIGTADALLASNRALHAEMTRLRIPHAYEEYDGDHVNGLRERIERSVLPFFSMNLAAPANPTSPLPKS